MTYRINHSTSADRRLGAALTAGHQGSTSDEYELFVGSPDTPIGRAVAAPQVPRDGVDARRLWQVGAQGQENTWTDVGSVAQDASGMVISPRPAGTPGTDIVTTGYVLPYELADGGTIVVESVGTYRCGSVTPRILAKLKIGGAYVSPQYEAMMNATGTDATPVDLAAVTADAFEWSSLTCGLNALGGYEALHIDASNLTAGEFLWRMTMRIHSLGRWAKWQRFNNSGTGAASTKDRTCWVEATLEWGALAYNAGGRIASPPGYQNPLSARTLQYSAFVQRDTGTPAAGTVRGAIYSFLGQQWLCHAASDVNAVASGPPDIDYDVWSNMLAEEAPGMGLHWREFFVPAVSKATISGFATVDWTAGNEVQLELGGPQQEDLGNTWGTYGATTAYTAELGTSPFTGGSRGVVDTGVVYAPKTYLYVTSWPRMIAGTSTALWTAAPTGASPDSERAWRALPATLRDTMRMQTTQAYLFGRRNGTAQRRMR